MNLEFRIPHKIIKNPKSSSGTGRDLEKNRNTIVRQLQTKILFLHKEFSEELRFSDYFKGSNPETIIKDLYNLRSKIAHGENLDWTKDLKDLVPKEKGIKQERYFINEFMIELCRNILKIAIKQPDMIKDLREI